MNRAIVQRVGVEPTNLSGQIEGLPTLAICITLHLYANAYEFKCFYAIICICMQKYHIWHFRTNILVILLL